MTTDYIEHQHDKGIEIYHFRQVSRAAIDEFYSIAMPIFKSHVEQYQDNMPLFYVLDLSESGMFPVKYMMNKALTEMNKFEYRPLHFIAYVIANTQDKMLIDILSQLSARNLGHTRKIFKPDELDDAITWLHEVRAPFLQNTG